jgi:hypothetical protein
VGTLYRHRKKEPSAESGHAGSRDGERDSSPKLASEETGVASYFGDGFRVRWRDVLNDSN